MGVEGTKHVVDVRFVELLRFEEGMMVEYWGVSDSTELLRQLS